MHAHITSFSLSISHTQIHGEREPGMKHFKIYKASWCFFPLINSLNIVKTTSCNQHHAMLLTAVKKNMKNEYCCVLVGIWMVMLGDPQLARAKRSDSLACASGLDRSVMHMCFMSSSYTNALCVCLYVCIHVHVCKTLRCILCCCIFKLTLSLWVPPSLCHFLL